MGDHTPIKKWYRKKFRKGDNYDCKRRYSITNDVRLQIY